MFFPERAFILRPGAHQGRGDRLPADCLALLPQPDQALVRIQIIRPQGQRAGTPARGLGVQPQQEGVQLRVVTCGRGDFIVSASLVSGRARRVVGRRRGLATLRAGSICVQNASAATAPTYTRCASVVSEHSRPRGRLGRRRHRRPAGPRDQTGYGHNQIDTRIAAQATVIHTAVGPICATIMLTAKSATAEVIQESRRRFMTATSIRCWYGVRGVRPRASRAGLWRSRRRLA